ncbi:MAG TPA: hypothetical protein VLJ40_11105 [Arthrobacter sp.]|nr:hypothetical protein [Arthrobacter sp.]
MIAAVALMAALAMGPAAPADLDTFPPDPTPPNCYGSIGWHNAWNLVNPMTVYNVDSCTANQLVATRNLAGNYASYVALLAARVPAMFPTSVYALAWNTSNAILAQCASRGTGVTFYQSGFNGMVITCSAQ